MTCSSLSGVYANAVPVSYTHLDVYKRQMFTGMCLGVLVAWQYGRTKAGKHPKFAVHALYWWLPSDLFVTTKATPRCV